jgi:hypothetical protein
MADDGETGRQDRRHILEGMDGDVDIAGEQRLLDLLGEERLAALVGERAVGDAVAAGADDNGLDGGIAAEILMRRSEPLPQLRRLRQSERAAAGAETQDGFGHAFS